ncbi:hypothetical protein K0A96_00695 [Patescibacteria group bacterium]|nr:hypothetical protein [Patescibacteria group bacterium]
MKYKICVSGAANTDCCAVGAKEKTIKLGEEIVKQGGVLVTGATTGAPFWATVGTKKAKGFSIGMSPAATELEHVKKYRLPTNNFDMIVYTGFGYSGRNLMLTRSSDAVIIVCGRMGTLNEFTIAFEDRKPIGVLTETGGTADRIEEIVKSSKRGLGKIVYSSDPKELVSQVIALIKKEKAKINNKK